MTRDGFYTSIPGIGQPVPRRPWLTIRNGLDYLSVDTVESCRSDEVSSVPRLAADRGEMPSIGDAISNPPFVAVQIAGSFHGRLSPTSAQTLGAGTFVQQY